MSTELENNAAFCAVKTGSAGGNDKNKLDDSELNILEDALTRGGKSKTEVDSVVTVDRAQTEADQAQERSGPLHRSFMEERIAIELFACLADQSEWQSGPARDVLESSIAEVIAHDQSGMLYGADQKLTSQVHDALGRTRFWGLPIPAQYGGAGASMWFCMRAITRMGAVGAEIVGGLLSIEELIGAAGPLIWKGTAEQNAELLPELASGRLRSGFAGTERYVGSWITHVHTVGVEDGDDIVVTGDKLFISNAWYGHMVALFLKVNGAHKVLLVKLPDHDTENFRIVNYPIHALRRIHNKGLWFKDFRVPRKYLLPGNGLAAIFHDLDRGRPAVAAGAGARQRRLLKSELPWVNMRETFGEKLNTRQYIKHNMAVQAAYMVGTDALVDWSAALMDAGYQGDVSSMIAKTQATDWLREVVTNQSMFTHGGRFVLGGHIIGDNLADDLVASVYEGPNPMLGKAAIKSLAKPFAEEFVKPLIVHMMKIGLDPSMLKFGNFKQSWASISYLLKERSRILTDGALIAGQSNGHSPSAIRYFWMHRKELRNSGLWATAVPLVKWIARTETTFADNRKVPGLEPRLQEVLNFARRAFIRWKKKFYRAVVVYQERLADEDLLMLEELYKPLEDIATIFASVAAAQAARRAGDDATADALLLLCLILKRDLNSEQNFSGSYKKLVNTVFEHILNGSFKQLEGVPEPEILMPYTADDFLTWGLPKGESK